MTEHQKKPLFVLLICLVLIIQFTSISSVFSSPLKDPQTYLLNSQESLYEKKVLTAGISQNQDQKMQKTTEKAPEGAVDEKGTVNNESLSATKEGDLAPNQENGPESSAQEGEEAPLITPLPTQEGEAAEVPPPPLQNTPALESETPAFAVEETALPTEQTDEGPLAAGPDKEEEDSLPQETPLVLETPALVETADGEEAEEVAWEEDPIIEDIPPDYSDVAYSIEHLFEDPVVLEMVRQSLVLRPTEYVTAENLLLLEALGTETDPVSSLKGLEGAKNLTMLYILHGGSLWDLGPLRGLENLYDIAIEGTNISDLSPLATASQLTNFIFNGTKVSDISVLKSLPRLRNVVANNNYIRDISPIVDLVTCCCFDLDNNQIIDVSVLPKEVESCYLSIAGQRRLINLGALDPNTQEYRFANPVKSFGGDLPPFLEVGEGTPWVTYDPDTDEIVIDITAAKQAEVLEFTETWEDNNYETFISFSGQVTYNFTFDHQSLPVEPQPIATPTPTPSPTVSPTNPPTALITATPIVTAPAATTTAPVAVPTPAPTKLLVATLKPIATENVPKTGDESPFGLYLISLGGALVMGTTALILLKRCKKAR